MASMVLPVPGGPYNNTPPTATDAEFFGQFGVLEGVDHFQTDVFFDILQAGDVVKAELGFFLD
ncbi:MAG TPA: hypothetical protein VHP11_02450, partial [Tepidisphaeraceae bacterium]|nr:hypothetical protein [Tepidisphaeraceae bacterium]